MERTPMFLVLICSGESMRDNGMNPESSKLLKMRNRFLPHYGIYQSNVIDFCKTVCKLTTTCTCMLLHGQPFEVNFIWFILIGYSYVN